MSTLYFDCFSGASGDMVLGALIDAGVPLDEVRRALGSLAIDPAAVWTDRVNRAGITATKFCVRGEDAEAVGAAAHHAHTHAHTHDHVHSHDHAHGAAHSHAHAHEHDHHAADEGEQAHGHSHGHGQDHHGPGDHGHEHRHDHDHDHGHHAHRSLAEIYRLIDTSALSGPGKARAKALFARLGEAEAAIHGMPVEQVHLHEVGALDSIVDIVGAVFALEWLGATRVVASPLNVGSGTVRSAHGLYPVPAPATLRLLEGAPVYAGPQQGELVTPTGALLVTAYAGSYGPMPAMRVRKIGYGAGTRNPAGTPNVLRVVIGEADAPVQTHDVAVIECEIDDMNPQIFGALMDRLLAEGALDVFYTPIQMKKNRPGTLLTVIAPPARREALTATLFRESTTIGVRYSEMRRECLDRETVSVQTPLGAVRFKVARRGAEVLNASPEFDDLARLAAATGRPIKDVQALAVRSYLEQSR